jgi:hypothetical protein
MSVLTPIKSFTKESKVHSSQYLRTENEGDKSDAKPAESPSTEQPEAK